MIESVGDKCSGCSACANICPKGCISMQPNSEGFLYPFVNQEICVKCRLCEKTCPVLHPPVFAENDVPLAYAVQNRDENIRMDSTSGGAFTAIAQYVIDRGGVVFGAIFDESFDVVHSYVERKEDLHELRRSKYVQSRIGNSFKQAKDFLDKGRWVCFSGTPCQIGGLKSFLRKDYDKLVSVDIACHGVPSPKFWCEYKRFQEKKNSSKILFADFRYKKNGYSSSVMALKFENGKNYFHGHESDYMLKAFFSEIVSRKSCSDCSFKTLKRVSDFTIFDCWSIGKINRSMDDNKGTTTFLIHSRLGSGIWNDVASNFVVSNVDAKMAVALDGDMVVASKKANSKREEFFRDLNILDFEKLCNRYIPITKKDLLKKVLKPFLYKLGILKRINQIMRVCKK